MSVIDKMLRDLDARGAPAHLTLLDGDGAAAGATPSQRLQAPPAPQALHTPHAPRTPHSPQAAHAAQALPPATAPAALLARRAPPRPALRLALLVGLGVAAVAATAFGDLSALFGGGAKAPSVAAVSVSPGPQGPSGIASDVTAPPAAVADQVSTAPSTPSIPPAAAPGASMGMGMAQAPAQPDASSSASATASTPVPALPRQAAPAMASSARPRAAAAPAALAAPAATPGTEGTPSRATASTPTRSGVDAALVPPTPARIDKRLHALDPSQRQAKLYRAAVDAAQAGQRLAAIQTAHELLALNPQHEPARQLAAHLELEAGAPGRAAALLREGLAVDARSVGLALALARLFATQGLAEEALTVLETHAVPGPEAAGLRAGVLARRGDYAAALPAYEAAARAQPLNPMWWLGLGVALESLGEPARARQAFIKAQAIGLPREDLSAYAEQRLRALE